jgi:hypothetical protein
MLTFKSVTNGVATIDIDVDGTTYSWTVGGIVGIADVQSHLSANADTYRADVRTALGMGRVLEVVVEPTLAEAQAAAISAAAAACDAALAPLAARFGVLERLTWERQLAEAKAVLADPTLTADKYPTIAGIIAVTGETVADFAAAVLKNNEDWTAVSANVVGQRQALVARIKACTEPADVAAIPISITLPS